MESSLGVPLPGTFRRRSDPQSISYLIREVKLAARSRDLERGRELHQYAGEFTDIYVSNRLIDMYAKCGSMAEARRVFDKITAPTVVSWNSLILGYAENGDAGQALQLFSKIAGFSAISPDRATFLAALKACSKLAVTQKTSSFFNCKTPKFVKSKSLETTVAIHSLCEQSGWDRDMLVASALIDAYGKCKSMDSAQMIFEGMAVRDAVSWSSMIQGYADNEDGLSGLELFEVFMSSSSDRATARMFVAALKSCSSLAAKEEWKKIEDSDGKLAKMVSLEKAMFLHREAAERGFHLDVFVASTLVDLYAKCGSIDLARAVFEKLDHRSKSNNAVVWNALILGYVELGQAEMALDLFSRMLLEQRSIKKNEIFLSIVAAAKACSSLAAKELASQVADSDHGQVLAIRMESLATGMAIHAKARDLDVDSHLFVATALIDMYSKCGSMTDAYRTFVNLGQVIDDPAPWNTLILGYLDNGQLQASLSLLHTMRALSPSIMDARSYAIAIKVCASAMDLEGLRKLHAEIEELGRELIRMDPVLSSSLVDAYGRCGSMDDAESFFFASSSRDFVSWIALIAGYSRQGNAERAIDVFQRMRDEGLDPGPAALQCVLSACAHTGRVEQAKELLSSYISSTSCSASMEHFHCAIDMLGRADRVDEAVALVESVISLAATNLKAMQPNAVTWSTVMDASRRSGEVGAAEVAFRELLKIADQGSRVSSSAYELMATVYQM